MSTPDRTLAAIVLAAGRGTRMRAARPKVLHEVAGRPLVLHALDALARLAPPPGRTVVVVGHGAEEVTRAVAAHPLTPATARQDPPRGTGDALARALEALEGGRSIDRLLVLCGDVPLIAHEDLAALLAALDGPPASRPAVAVLGFRAPPPNDYGRLVVDGRGRLERIVETAEATDDERAIDLCNSGVMAFEAAFARTRIDRLSPHPPKGEYYLTDLVAMARTAGRTVAVVEARDPDTLAGVNSPADLAKVEALFQNRRRTAMLAAGVRMNAPETVHFAADTEIAADVRIDPHVVFGPGVRIAEGARIRSFSHLEGVEIGPGAEIGPFARLRPGSRIGARARVGNFVEVKKAVLGEGAKAGHLSYLGDAEIGARANIGAGTITCNYDGFDKHRTVIGADAFIGSNTALVAPVTIGEGAMVGAGSTITRTVAPYALALTRAAQEERAGWARAFRARRLARRRARGERDGSKED